LIEVVIYITVESNLWLMPLEKQDLNSKIIMSQNYKNVETVKPGGLELKDRLVGIQRVTKVTKGGRAFGFSAIVVVGDENGVVGHGLGKSKEVATAISKAIEDAKKNLG